METGLILPVPEAEALVRDLRARHDPNAALGAPAHLTVLYPFRPWARVRRSAIVRLKQVLRGVRPFEIRFASTGRFPGVLWLAPEPGGPARDLIGAVAEAFPECQPYGGRVADPAPHLTVAMDKDETVLDGVESILRARLTTPVQTRVEALDLYLRTGQGWRQRRRFRLG